MESLVVSNPPQKKQKKQTKTKQKIKIKNHKG